MNKDEQKHKFYLTTPIFYPNDVLHLGHVYTLTLSDAISRFKILKGFEVFLQTGSDEHGEKIFKTASSKGIKPHLFVDSNVEKFKELWKKTNILNSYYFMRTSFSYHKEKVQEIFKYLLKKGDVYLGKYSGMYCISCEDYESKEEKCSSCGSSLKMISEECFFLKVEKYREKLLSYYREEKIKVYPQNSLNELFGSFLNREMPDLCITRKNLDWGIEVPNCNDKSTFYVWFDALCNYITSPIGEDFFSTYSKDKNREIVQLIGKDILRFHLVYWPIILISLEKKLPDKIISHGWIISSGKKMSKSKGNAVDPFSIIDKYGSDSVRSYFCSKISIYNDGLFSEKKISDFHNDFFVNNLGNLFSRVFSMLEKYFGSEIPFKSSSFQNFEISNYKNIYDNKICKEERILSYVKLVEREVNLYEKNMDCFELTKSFSNIENIIIESNKMISTFSPWNLFKNNENKLLSDFIILIINSIKVVSFMIWPFAPECSEKIFSVFNLKFSDINFSNLLSLSHLRNVNFIRKPKNHLFKKIEK